MANMKVALTVDRSDLMKKYQNVPDYRVTYWHFKARVQRVILGVGQATFSDSVLSGPDRQRIIHKPGTKALKRHQKLSGYATTIINKDYYEALGFGTGSLVHHK